MIPLFKVCSDVPAVSKNLLKVFESGYLGQGAKVEEFEKALAKELCVPDIKSILTVNSCTTAIQLALKLINVKGKYVITTPQTCTATNTAILAMGGSIFWADVHPLTGNILPESIDKIIEELGIDNCFSKLAAIVCVDWAGVSCDYAGIRAVLEDWGLDGVRIIEDAAHAYKTEGITSYGGDYTCYSFQAIKHLTCGDGGAIVLPKEEETRAKLLRWYGLDRESSASFRCEQNIKEAGYKWHMNDISATIGLSNMEVASNYVESSRKNAQIYYKNLGPDIFPAYNTPKVGGSNPAWWLVTIHVPARDKFIKWMTKMGVATSQVHARNDHHDCFPALMNNISYDGLLAFSETQVSIPSGYWLSERDVDYISELILIWVNHHKSIIANEEKSS